MIVGSSSFVSGQFLAAPYRRSLMLSTPGHGWGACKPAPLGIPALPASSPSNNDPVQRARKGYKNSWSRHKVDDSQQVAWQQPLKQDPTVAIIGGGLSGLCCALELAHQGVRSVVFDTGSHSCGGRMATRTTRDKSIRPTSMQDQAFASAGLAFDHGAQYFTAKDPRFLPLVKAWEAAGVIKSWDGPVGTLKPGGAFTPLPSSSTRYVAVKGMRSLAQHIEGQLLSQYGDLVQVRRPVWVGKMIFDQAEGWKLSGEGRSQGSYDAVVIAHNGKCANRLVGPSGAPLVARQLMGLRLSAVWALSVAFDKPLPVDFEGAVLEGNDVVSWVANNTAKMGLKHPQPGISCWTLISTNAYGQKNKVPQEAVPRDVQDKVAGEMLDAFAAALGKPRSDFPAPIFYRCQLWGAAQPINTLSVECILDPVSRVGVVGDWCSGNRMQAAALSGITLAKQLSALRGKGVQAGELDEFKIGLKESFTPLA